MAHSHHQVLYLLGKISMIFYVCPVNRNPKLLLACDTAFALTKYGPLECTYFAQNHAFGYMTLTIHIQDNADVNSMRATSTLDQYDDIFFFDGLHYDIFSFGWIHGIILVAGIGLKS